MNDTPLAPPKARTNRSALRLFLRHYLEMIIAMAVGMVALHPVWAWAAAMLGWSGLLARADVGALVMATNMTVAMSAWMRYRGHGWRPIAEMAAAMYLPFVVLFAPLWAGLISGDTVLLAGHVLMLPAMAGVMLLRPDEHTRHRH